MVALDLEGSGSQDRDQEAILEIALVPLSGGRPDVVEAWQSLVNPGRPIVRLPWISPGLTDLVLAAAPHLADIEEDLRRRLDGRILVGHNVRVDWRLLHRRCPSLRPVGLIDTLQLARYVHPRLRSRSLTALLAEHGLTARVNALIPGGQPHRALWDTVGAALLLPALIHLLPGGDATTAEHLRQIAGVDADGQFSRQSEAHIEALF
jgi:DNA polymerase-3 subunit epsilon/exodeoxyribonuclease X